MAIKALVDNTERYAVQRAGHLFLGDTKNQEFHGTAYDLAQVRGSIYLRVHDIEEVGIAAHNARILPDITEDIDNPGSKIALNDGMASGGGGGIDNPQGTSGGTTANASSAARAYAQQNDLDLAEVARSVKGSGSQGRLTLDDVKGFNDCSNDKQKGEAASEKQPQEGKKGDG